MVNSIGYNSTIKTNSCVPMNTASVTFHSKTNNLEKTPQSDVFQKKSNQNKKNKLPVIAKIAIGTAGVGIALVTTLTLISKGQTKRLTKLYKEKLVTKVLPEHIKFNEAKNIEEALKFTKETLGIHKIDKNISLEALNYINRGIVDVSNANKGKVFIPSEITFKKSKDSTIASVIQDINSKHFGALNINKSYFSHDFLNTELKNTLQTSKGEKLFNSRISSVKFNNKNIHYLPDEKYYKQVQKFYTSPESLNINEKRDLLWGFHEISSCHDKIYINKPEEIYKMIIKKHGNQKYTIEEFKKFESLKQQEILDSILETKPIGIEFSTNNGLDTIYHEMGHLQDFGKNLKELDLKQWDFNFVKIFKEALEDAKNKTKNIKPTDSGNLDFINNRWGGKTYEGYEKLLKESPEKFKSRYPDLYKHITDKEIQKITGQVSWYAQTGIGEFIAEVYAGLIKGKKYSNEIMNLYKKYNGPLLPGM